MMNIIKPDYIKDEYNFVVFHKAIDDVGDGIWSYEKTEEDAIRRVKIETDAYGDVEEYQFYYLKYTEAMPSTNHIGPVETAIASCVDAEEMTIAEIEALLGHSVKIVK